MQNLRPDLDGGPGGVSEPDHGLVAHCACAGVTSPVIGQLLDYCALIGCLPGLLEGELGGGVVPGGVSLPPPLGEEQHGRVDVVEQPRPVVGGHMSDSVYTELSLVI